MALAPGTHLGPYEIQSALGAGGMGEVYKARDTRLDRTVAIKVLPEHVACDPELKRRFEREAKTLATLSHPHICPVFDVGSQDGLDFLVMEHLEGETLEQRLKKGALPLDALESVSLFTGAPRGPFVSPDGQWVGFADGTSVLKRVAITGGPPVTIATLVGNTRGATWMPDDTIVFATNATDTGLQQVAAAGGPTTVLTRPDRARGDADHVWPEPLPDGRSVLFTILPVVGGIEAAQVAVLDRQTGTQTVIVRGGSHAHYVGSGHLVYAAANALLAVAFDPVTLETRGTPIPCRTSSRWAR